jgi:hypothetical protein
MRKLITATALLILLGTPVAVAQNSKSKSSSGASSSSGTGLPEAPVGHRQPKASDVPSEKNADKLDAENAALDKKIKSICRGC